MQIYKPMLFLFLFLGLLFRVEPIQAINLDSLLNLANIEKAEKPKCDKYLYYLSKLATLERDSAKQLMLELEEQSRTKGFVYGEARARSLRAYYLFFNARYEEGLKLMHHSLVQQKQCGDTLGMALTMNRIGLANMHFKRYSDARNYMNVSLAYFKMYNDTPRIDIGLNNLGVLAFNQNLYAEAIGYYKQTLVLRLIKKDNFFTGYAYYNIGDAFFQNHQTDSAKYYLTLAYETFLYKTETGRVPPMIYLGLGHLYKELNDDKNAIKFSLLGLEASNIIDQTPLQMEAKQLLSELYFKQKQFEKAYSLQSDWVFLKNQIDSSNNVEQATEVEEKYKNAEKEKEIALLESQKLEAENNAQSIQLWLISILAVLILVSAVFILSWQRRNQTDKVSRLNLNTEIAKARMFALRAQMNPHFIFNSINTAQNFVMNNQKEQAYEYLSNFARLLRWVMENSADTFIPLEDELNQLKLYLELESIRFEQKFSYTISVDPELEIGVYELPGMILQPIVENAIGHGLINRKDSLGVLTIELVKEEEFIRCTISDNGVGRIKAQEIKAAKEVRYQSAAIPNIQERLLMLQKETNRNITIEVKDLLDAGKQIGTRVIILLPFQ